MGAEPRGRHRACPVGRSRRALEEEEQQPGGHVEEGEEGEDEARRAEHRAECEGAGGRGEELGERLERGDERESCSPWCAASRAEEKIALNDGMLTKPRANSGRPA